MITAPATISSALDRFHVALGTLGARAAIGYLAAALARHRATAAFDEWQASCAAIASHPALFLLAEDPYSRDARRKPSGYAGDARTLDYVYLQNAGAQPLSDTGRSLFEVSTSVPIAAAVRDRCAVLASEITRAATAGARTVASIACGHARELDRIAADVQARIRYWGMDQDAASVAYCTARGGCAPAVFEVGSVRDLIAGRIRVPASDVIYASGLFDYLEDRAGAVLVKQMFRSLNAGGILLVPNLTPANDEAGYMEAVMDWWMCYRTESAMRRLAVHVDSTCARTSTFTTSDGRIAWLRIERG